MFHDSVSQCLMLGPSCSPAKHFLSAPGMTMGMQSFSDQSWEPEDRPVFPGMQPIRKEMEGTQDVLSTVSHTAVERTEPGGLAGAGGRLVHRDFLHITTSPVEYASMMEWDSLLRFSITPVLPLFSFHVKYDLTCLIPPSMWRRFRVTLKT